MKKCSPENSPNGVCTFILEVDEVVFPLPVVIVLFSLEGRPATVWSSFASQFCICSCSSGRRWPFFPSVVYEGSPAASNFTMTVQDLSSTNPDPVLVNGKRSVENGFHLLILSRTTWSRFLANPSVCGVAASRLATTVVP